MVERRRYAVEDFAKHAREHIEQLSGPAVEILTIDGQPRAAVMSAEAYEHLRSLADVGRTATAVRAGMRDTEAGRVEDAEQAIRAAAKNLGIPLD